MTPAAYYNEIDPFAAQWLRNLIQAGHIAPGDVDERSIEDVHPLDLKSYAQCHFFAGIGIWSHALRRAGWADRRQVWTASCPCQPFSATGQRGGFDDERHLWPHLYYLIEQCRPPVLFGEQVASPDGLEWLDLVRADLEASRYAFGASDMCSAGVGAPHIRQRIYWVGHADDTGLERHWVRHQTACEWEREIRPVTASGQSGGAATCSKTNGFWRDADWLRCRDDKWRPVEPGSFPLAHGDTSRVGRLRAYGNAINAELAATFVQAYRGIVEEI